MGAMAVGLRGLMEFSSQEDSLGSDSKLDFDGSQNHVVEHAMEPNRDISGFDMHASAWLESWREDAGLAVEEDGDNQEAADQSQEQKGSEDHVRKSTNDTKRANPPIIEVYLPDPKHSNRKILYFECVYCNKQFHKRYLLKRHFPVHTGQRQHICPLCGESFTSSSTLSRHKAVHREARFHQCPDCGKSFSRMSTLAAHRDTHSKKKRFVCQICEKGFHQKGNLKNHMFTHSKERPFCCELCHTSFTQRTNLTVHMKRNHADEFVQYKCHQCSQVFSLRKELRAHQLDMHHDTIKETLAKTSGKSGNPSLFSHTLANEVQESTTGIVPYPTTAGAKAAQDRVEQKHSARHRPNILSKRKQSTTAKKPLLTCMSERAEGESDLEVETRGGADETTSGSQRLELLKAERPPPCEETQAAVIALPLTSLSDGVRDTSGMTAGLVVSNTSSFRCSKASYPTLPHTATDGASSSSNHVKQVSQTWGTQSSSQIARKESSAHVVQRPIKDSDTFENSGIEPTPLQWLQCSSALQEGPNREITLASHCDSGKEPEGHLPGENSSCAQNNPVASTSSTLTAVSSHAVTQKTSQTWLLSQSCNKRRERDLSYDCSSSQPTICDDADVSTQKRQLLIKSSLTCRAQSQELSSSSLPTNGENGRKKISLSDVRNAVLPPPAPSGISSVCACTTGAWPSTVCTLQSAEEKQPSLDNIDFNGHTFAKSIINTAQQALNMINQDPFQSVTDQNPCPVQDNQHPYRSSSSERIPHYDKLPASLESHVLSKDLRMFSKFTSFVTCNSKANVNSTYRTPQNARSTNKTRPNFLQDCLVGRSSRQLVGECSIRKQPAGKLQTCAIQKPQARKEHVQSSLGGTDVEIQPFGGKTSMIASWDKNHISQLPTAEPGCIDGVQSERQIVLPTSVISPVEPSPTAIAEKPQVQVMSHTTPLPHSEGQLVQLVTLQTLPNSIQEATLMPMIVQSSSAGTWQGLNNMDVAPPRGQPLLGEHDFLPQML